MCWDLEGNTKYDLFSLEREVSMFHLGIFVTTSLLNFAARGNGGAAMPDPRDMDGGRVMNTFFPLRGLKKLN